MLTASVVRTILARCFAGQRAKAVLEAMASRGIVRPGPQTEFSPHNAAICMIACALPEADAAKALAASMLIRDWPACAVAEGWRLASGQHLDGLRGVRLVRVLCGEIYCREASSWWISPAEISGHSLIFHPGHYGAEHGGRLPERLREPGISIPGWVMTDFGRQHQSTAQQIEMNRLLLARISRTIRLDPVREATPSITSRSEAAE